MEFYECCVVRVNIGGLYYNYNNLINVYFFFKRFMYILCLFRLFGVFYLVIFYFVLIVYVFVCFFVFRFIIFYIFDLFFLIFGLI